MTNLLNLTQNQIKELKELENYQVDYSDIPQTTDFSNAKFKYYELKPKKEVITLRLDSDLVAVLKSLGKGYQSKINQTLRNVYLKKRYKKATNHHERLLFKNTAVVICTHFSLY